MKYIKFLFEFFYGRKMNPIEEYEAEMMIRDISLFLLFVSSGVVLIYLLTKMFCS